MAVQSNPEYSRLTLVQEVGTTVDGDPIYKRKSYSNIKWEASDQDVYDVAQGLASLSQYPTVRIERTNDESLTEI